MNDIKLNFINKSDDTNKANIVIFQRNFAQEFGEVAIAWKVIRNLDQNDQYPFVYSTNVTVAASDKYGNFSPSLLAYDGAAYEMVQNTSGDVLQVSSTPAENSNYFEIKNAHAHPSSIISAHCYRDGNLIAKRTEMTPNETAVFEFKPQFFIGVAPDIEQGDVLDVELISQISTQINLFGVTSADIVMTGGGPGSNDGEFSFTLENINKQ